jgi:hypothetical protein
MGSAAIKMSVPRGLLGELLVFEASKAVKLEWARRAFVVGAGIATLSQVSQEFLRPLMHNALCKQGSKK